MVFPFEKEKLILPQRYSLRVTTKSILENSCVILVHFSKIKI